MPKAILITGATGKQGGSVLETFLAHSQITDFVIYALTRDASSPKAKSLASKPNVKVVEGDLDDCDAIFKKIPETIWGVFSVQQMGPNEEQQGKALVDVAIAKGIRHFVYSSVDRGGTEKSDIDSTNVPHFITKYNIEKYLIEKAKFNPWHMTWTILRPVFFFENLSQDFQGKGIATIWRDLGKSGGKKKIQMIATADIGLFAVKAFLDPDTYNHQAISLAGDELSFEEGNAIFKKTVGHDLPTTFGFVGQAIRYMVKDLGLMFNWFEKVGYGANIKELRNQEPGLKDFKKWLEDDSPWKSGKSVLDASKITRDNKTSMIAGTTTIILLGIAGGLLAASYGVGGLSLPASLKGIGKR